MSHPTVFSAQFNVLGWGPSLSVFVWEKRLAAHHHEFHWRYCALQFDRVEITVQWL